MFLLFQLLFFVVAGIKDCSSCSCPRRTSSYVSVVAIVVFFVVVEIVVVVVEILLSFLLHVEQDP